MANAPIKLSSVAVDLEREEKGDWMDSLIWPGVRYKVSSLHIPAYVTARQLMFQRLQRRYKGDVVPVEDMAREAGQLLAKHILHDWAGFDESYAPEVASARLADLSFRALRQDIEDAANRLGEPDIEYVEDAGKK